MLDGKDGGISNGMNEESPASIVGWTIEVDEGYSDPVSTVGPGEGCPVSAGELDGAKDTFG